EPPVAADPDELRPFEDRKELVLDVHDRKGWLDLRRAAGTGLDRLWAAGTGLQQHGVYNRFTRAGLQKRRVDNRLTLTRLQRVPALQRLGALLLRQIRIELRGFRICVLAARRVDLCAGSGALHLSIRGI